ncbi:DNA-binding transcriptional regulator, MerR family [Brevibacterium sandarakinum]|uniref:DNA-binding transcriptional regulator, MerR family n=1 Tax=Brevibacterium sandarakinum TaxID=629680 RepID=A0A1H1RF02_BRESA|nr:MerR family transcriptional regulator [Brevibacterium sandarakinum]SDS34331.1 DNA-binding transcriptional regulator, MerR family [Brevibacterium sandarakinum]
MAKYTTNNDVTVGLMQIASTETGTNVHIGEMAEKSGLSSQTLRRYEDMGLLPPTVRTEGGFRVYTDDDLQRLMTVRQMKALNYSTTEMGEMLTLLETVDSDAAEDQRSQARLQLLALIDDATTKRNKLARQIERADEFLSILRTRLT